MSKFKHSNIEIENLKAKIFGHNLTLKQEHSARLEFEKLLEYIEQLENFAKPSVVVVKDSI